MSLIVPGGRPVAPSGPIPIDFSFLVGVEKDGNVAVMMTDSQNDISYSHEGQPDEIFGAISVILHEDGVSGMQILYDTGTEPYESVFMVMRMANGKVLLSPNILVKVNPVREPSREHIFSALSVLHGNILAMKAADMVMASLQGAAQMEQNIAIARAAGVG